MITDVRIELADDPPRDGCTVLCYARIVFAGVFVVRELKLLRGPRGDLFVAMPERALKDRCPSCGKKNELASLYCGHCREDLGGKRPVMSSNNRPKFHQDVAHPITQLFRAQMEKAIVEAYEREAGCPSSA